MTLNGCPIVTQIAIVNPLNTTQIQEQEILTAGHQTKEISTVTLATATKIAVSKMATTKVQTHSILSPS
jgi:hypothetical protein